LYVSFIEEPILSNLNDKIQMTNQVQSSNDKKVFGFWILSLI